MDNPIKVMDIKAGIKKTTPNQEVNIAKSSVAAGGTPIIVTKRSSNVIQPIVVSDIKEPELTPSEAETTTTEVNNPEEVRINTDSAAPEVQNNSEQTEDSIPETGAEEQQNNSDHAVDSEPIEQVMQAEEPVSYEPEKDVTEGSIPAAPAGEPNDQQLREVQASQIDEVEGMQKPNTADTKQYYLPIGASHHQTSHAKMMINFAVVFVLISAVVVYFLADAGIIDLGFKLPLDLIK